jgi:hypothetical protein
VREGDEKVTIEYVSDGSFCIRFKSGDALMDMLYRLGMKLSCDGDLYERRWNGLKQVGQPTFDVPNWGYFKGGVGLDAKDNVGFTVPDGCKLETGGIS